MCQFLHFIKMFWIAKLYIKSLLQRDGLRQDDGNSLEPSIFF